MRRFFLKVPISETMVIDGSDARHISTVLRLAVGDKLLVSGVDGQAGRVEIIKAAPEAVHIKLLEIIDDKTEPPIDVVLVQGLAKGEKMDFIIQKAVELGAVGVVPLAAEHSVVRYDAKKQADKVARWQKIAQEAAKQCGRSVIPTIYPIKRLAEVLTENEFSAADKIMLYEGKAAAKLKQALGSNRKSYLLFIGPEGGFSANEVRLCKEHGVSVVTMGPRIMRTETAALAAITAVMYEYGDLGG